MESGPPMWSDLHHLGSMDNKLKLYEAYANTNGNLTESNEKENVEAFNRLADLGSKPVINTDYIAISLMLINNELTVTNQPELVKLVKVNPTSYLLKLLEQDNRIVEFPIKSSSVNVPIITVLFDSLNSYDKFCMFVELQFSATLPKYKDKNITENKMSSIMKGIVDEGDWTGGIINWKKEVTSKHGPDVTFKKRKLPGVNGKTDTYATNSQGKVVGVYQHHNDMGRVLSETDAIKGADGKRCWKGKRYAGTENGKDKCIPVKNEAANPAQQAAIAIAKKKKAKTNEGVFDLLKKKPSPRDNMRERLSNMSTDELRQELKDYKSRLSGARASGSLVGAAVSDYINALKTEIDKRAFNDFSANTNEGVIVGHDANDPEIAILGGAGTMSLSRLKNKAAGEAQSLFHDMVLKGNFKAAAYNVKQLANTLNTIVAAEEEMEKNYFGENAWNQLGQRKPNTNLPAPERGSRVNHGKRFEEGDIVLPLSGPLKGQPHKVIHSQRTSIRIVPLGRDSYPGDTIAPRTKHEWVVPADMNEDYTDEFAAEKTAAVNPYGGLKDRQFRSAIGEGIQLAETPDTSGPVGTQPGGWRRTDLDEYREMSPALKAAQANLRAIKNKEKTINVPGTREKSVKEPTVTDKTKEPAIIAKGGQKVDPEMERMMADFLARGGVIKKGRPGKAPPTGRNQASKHIGGGGKYRKKSDTPGQGANYRGDKIVAVEELSRSDVDGIERFADKLYKKLGIDVTFTKHFMDRVNDERNGKPISGAELVRLFKKEYERWGKDVAQMGPDVEGTFKDLTTDINLPFVLRWDRDEEELDLIAKTVMRKKNFKTWNKEFPVDEDTSFGTGMGQGGNAGQSYRKFTPKSAGTFKKESAIMKGLKR